MLKRLTHLLAFRTGFHTQHINTLMTNFKPTSEEQCLEVLEKIRFKKEFIPQSETAANFADRIEYFILRKQNNISSTTLTIYQTIKFLELLTPTFKYGVLFKMQRQLAYILEKDLTIKNNQLEVLLWFIYREFPYLRNNVFQDIASEHTLKLFQMHDFMNSEKVMPTWEPYLRITAMLHCLGHEPELRQDISMKIINQINYTYLPYLTHMFPTEESCNRLNQQTQICEPLMINLCNRYIDMDKMNYDSYLHYIEVIDNEDYGEEIERVFDCLSWVNFTELLELYVQSYKFHGFEENLAYKINEIFWRICETKPVEVETAIRILEIISHNPGSLAQYEGSFYENLLESISLMGTSDMLNIPTQALLALLQAVANSPRLQQTNKKNFIQKLFQKTPAKLEWSPEQQEERKRIMEHIEKGIVTKSKIEQL